MIKRDQRKPCYDSVWIVQIANSVTVLDMTVSAAISDVTSSVKLVRK